MKLFDHQTKALRATQKFNRAAYSLTPVTMDGSLMCSVSIFGHVYNKKITHMFTLMACSRMLKLILKNKAKSLP